MKFSPSVRQQPALRQRPPTSTDGLVPPGLCPSVPEKQPLAPGRPAPHRLARSGPALPPHPPSRILTPAPPSRQRERPPARRLPPLWDDREPLPHKPLGARGRWIVRGLVLAVIVAGLLIALSQGNNAPTPASPSRAQPTPGQTAPPSGTPRAKPPTPRPTSNSASLASSPQGSPQQVTAQFLAAYFSWTATQSDQEYLNTWRALVSDASVADLVTASPRLTLDNGIDDAASSPLPIIPASVLQQQDGHAQIRLSWTIQVLPAGGERTQPQSRHIQATITLIQNTSSWSITTIAWTSV